MSWPLSGGDIKVSQVFSHQDFGGDHILCHHHTPSTHYFDLPIPPPIRGHRGCDHMIVGLIATYAISDLRQGRGFLRFPPPINKIDSHDITEILLKVALNTIAITPLTLFLLHMCYIQNVPLSCVYN
jgi:hypothetical protein